MTLRCRLNWWDCVFLSYDRLEQGSASKVVSCYSVLHPVGGQSLTKSHICVVLSGRVCERSVAGSTFSAPLRAHWYQKHHYAFAPWLKHFSRFEILTVHIFKKLKLKLNNRRVSTWFIGTLVFFLPHDKPKGIIAAFCGANFVCEEYNSTLIFLLF